MWRWPALFWVICGILPAQELLRSADPDYASYGDRPYTEAPVALEITVDSEGIPETLQASEADLPGGIPAPVVAAIRQYRFRPAKTGFRAHMFVAVRLFDADSVWKSVRVAPAAMEKRLLRRETTVAGWAAGPKATPATVTLVAQIDPSGRVVEANLRRGPVAKFEQARALALERVYQPTLVGGEPVSVVTEIHIQVAN
jgi:hypothetical protein